MKAAVIRFMTPFHFPVTLQVLLGLYLAWQVFGFQGGWLHAKIAAVVALSGVHGYFAKAVKSFGRGEYVGTPRYWRMMNEAPTLLMILIVVLAVVKPF